MKVLMVETSQYNLRGKIEGWTVEDSNLYIPGKPIGLTPSPEYKEENRPDTILEALSYKWKLLGPPQRLGEYFIWWLIKE